MGQAAIQNLSCFTVGPGVWSLQFGKKGNGYFFSSPIKVKTCFSIAWTIETLSTTTFKRQLMRTTSLNAPKIEHLRTRTAKIQRSITLNLTIKCFQVDVESENDSNQTR